MASSRFSLATCNGVRPRASLALTSASRLSKDCAVLRASSPLRLRAETFGHTAIGIQRVGGALAQLPYEQRETVLLHLQSGLKFRAIAELRGVSMNTVEGRYRYGLDRLRTLLDGKLGT